MEETDSIPVFKIKVLILFVMEWGANNETRSFLVDIYAHWKHIFSS